MKRDSIVHRAKNDRYPRYWRCTGGGTRRLARCSFTDPEYGQVGLTEEKARETYDVVTAVVRFDSTTRNQAGGDSHRRQNAGERLGSYSTLVSHIRRSQ